MPTNRKMFFKKIAFTAIAMALQSFEAFSMIPAMEAGFEKSLSQHISNISDIDKFKMQFQIASRSEPRENNFLKSSHAPSHAEKKFDNVNKKIEHEKNYDSEPQAKSEARPEKISHRNAGHFVRVAAEPAVIDFDNMFSGVGVYTKVSYEGASNNESSPQIEKETSEETRPAPKASSETLNSDREAREEARPDEYDDEVLSPQDEIEYGKKDANYYTDLLNSTGPTTIVKDKHTDKVKSRGGGGQLSNEGRKRKRLKTKSKDTSDTPSANVGKNYVADKTLSIQEEYEKRCTSCSKDSTKPAPCKKNKKRKGIPGRIEELARTLSEVSEEIKLMEISVNALGKDPSKLCSSEPVRKRAHFYAGLSVESGYLMNKDRVRSSQRKYTWNEQKIDYYSMIASVFSYPKRNEHGDILYGDDGLPEYILRQHPKDNPKILEHYDQKTGEIKPGQKEEVKKILKELVDDLIGINPKRDKDYSLNIVGKDNFNENVFSYTRIVVGENNYGFGINDAFYFGTRSGAVGELQYENGLDKLSNLSWNNLIFTDREMKRDVNDKAYQFGNEPVYDGWPKEWIEEPTNKEKGKNVTLAQVIGSTIEQDDKGTQHATKAGQIGMYTNLASEVYKFGNSDKFPKTGVLPAIDEAIKSYKPTYGTSVFLGLGTYAGRNTYLGVELTGGYSFAQSNSLLKTEKKKYDNLNLNQFDTPATPGTIVNRTSFADGNIQYVDKNDEVKNKEKGTTITKVYDPATDKVRPVGLSGMGRMAGPTKGAQSLPDPSNLYDIRIKKGLNFSVAPVIGFTSSNTMYYVSLGLSCDKYEVSITPNSKIFADYKDKLPVGYINGYMEDLGGSTYLHKYKVYKNANGEFITLENTLGEEKKIDNEKSLVPIYPGAVLATNTNQEQNTFAGVRLAYPHQDDGGISVVGEGKERPWMNPALAEEAAKEQKVSKFKISFEPGIGVKTYISSDYFLDFKYSVKVGSNFNLDHKSFGAYPVHMGRPDMKHSIGISEHKVRIGFGKRF